MKNTVFKRILCMVLMLTMLVIPVFAQELDVVSEEVTAPDFGDFGWLEEDLKAVAEDAAIIRINNNRYFYDNIGRTFSGNKEVFPYVENGMIYMPIAAVVTDFGYSVVEENERLLADKGGQSIVFTVDGSGIPAVMRHSEMYASVNDIAKAVGMKCFENGVIAIISSAEAVLSITVDVAQRLEYGLSYKWDNIKLDPLGYLTSGVTHPLDDELLYAVTDVGGMYRFDYENDYWLRLTDSAPAKYDYINYCRALAIDPIDTDVIYLTSGRGGATDKSGIFKSEDRGATWRRLNFDEGFVGQNFSKFEYTRFSAENIIVDPNNADILYVGVTADNGALWRSDDRGENWYEITSIPASVKDYPISFVFTDGREKTAEGNSKVIYAGSYGGGLMVSEDGGYSFSLVEGGPTNPHRMVYSDGGYYVSADGRTNGSIVGGFFRYKDGKWEDLSPDENGRPLSSCAIMVDKNNKNIIMVGASPYSSQGTYRTMDGGKTWELLNRDIAGPDFIQDPQNDKGVWQIDAKWLWYVEDFTADKVEFQRRDNGIEALVAQKGICLPSADGPMYLANFMDHGYRAQWTMYERAPESFPNINQGAGIDFCEQDPHYVVRAGLQGHPPSSTGQVDVSLDYGVSFVTKPWYTAQSICDIAVGATLQSNGHPIIMVMSTGDYNQGGAGKGIYRSKDGGETWELMAPRSTRAKASWFQIKMLASDRVDGRTFYYLEDSELYRTRNGGDTWEVIKNFETSHTWEHIVTAPGVEGGVWYTGEGGLHYSLDFGETWQTVSNFKEVGNVIGFGIGKSGTEYPAMYVQGSFNGGPNNFYISDDLGQTFRPIGIAGKQQSGAISGDRNYYGRMFMAGGSRGVTCGWPADLDTEKPVVTLTNESSTDEYGPEYATNEKFITISGTMSEIGEVRINGDTVLVDGYDNFNHRVELEKGENHFLIEARDDSYNFIEPQKLMIRYDPDFLDIGFDKETIVTSVYEAVISGHTAEPATIYIDGVAVKTDEDNRFNYKMNIDGSCQVEVYAIDAQGVRSATKKIDVLYDTTPPVITFDKDSFDTNRRYTVISGQLNEIGQVMINGQILELDPANHFETKVDLELGAQNIRIQARDSGKNATKPLNFQVERLSVDTANIVAKRKPANFIYDGKINEGEWELSYFCDKQYFGDYNNDCSFGLYWDDEYLYVAARVEDNYLYTLTEKTHESDSIEFYIDGGNEKTLSYDKNDKQIVYVPDSLRLNLDNFYFERTDFGYTMEARFKLSEFSITPKVGTVIGFELANNDNDQLRGEGMGRDGCYGFNGNSDTWREAINFANCTFVEQ